MPLKSTTLKTGETKTYKLPNIYDAEGHSPIITNTIPNSFITFDDNIDTFTFSPKISSDLDTTTVTVKISDGNLDNSYSFSVTV